MINSIRRAGLASRSALAALAVLAAVTGAMVAPSFVPASAPVPAALKAAEAQAAPVHCLNVARNTFKVTRGNFPAAIAAFKNTRGCGNTVADTICNASRHPSGGWARAMVRFITWGQYSRC